MEKDLVQVPQSLNFKFFYFLFICYGTPFFPWNVVLTLFQPFLYFRRCEVVVDPERPLLQPKTEQEWFDLYSRRPTYELGGGLMLVENINVIVKERNNL